MMLGVRPEDVQPSGGEQEATVSVVENMGPSKVLLVSWAARQIHIVVPATLQVQPGDTLSPRVDPQRVVLWPDSI